MNVFTGVLGVVFLVVLAVLGLGLYFLPTIIAKQNGHPSFGGIFALNFLLGWSLLGWIGSLIWALNKPQPMVVVQSGAVYAPQGYPQPMYPQNGYAPQGSLQQAYPPVQPGYAPQAYAPQPTVYETQPNSLPGQGYEAKTRDVFGRPVDPANDPPLS